MLQSRRKNIYIVNSPKVRLVDIEPVNDRVKYFPTTRYYGSKRKLLPWMYEHIKSLEFNTVLDGFGGTGSVSLLFKAMKKEVTYHDAFLFNTHVAKTVLSNKLCLTENDFQNFVGNVMSKTGVVQKNFKKIYYTNSENRWLDGFMEKALASNLTKQQFSFYMYTLFQACLKKRPFNLFHRANLNLRLNKKVPRQFGNLTTWERAFPELMIQSYNEISSSIWDARVNINILPPSNINKIKPGYDLVYFDPPYISHNGNNRDDYWIKYHFLEGISHYLEWDQLIEKDTSLKSITKPEKFLKWSRKGTFKDELYCLIEKHRHSIVVLSYVSNAYPDEEDIKKHFESIFSAVSIHTLDYKHALSKDKKRELLFIGRPL